MNAKSRAVLAAASLVIAVFVALPAAGQATYTVDPVQVKLAPGQDNTTITVTNQGTAELRLELEVFTWDHDEYGVMDLGATEDLLLFPPLITLQPGERQQVRLGVETTVAGTEKAYRLLVQEIPSQAASGGGQVSLRTVVSIPVFLQTGDSETDVQFDAEAGSGRISAHVMNRGNVHVSVDAITFRGLDADGLVVFEDNVPGWYVLAANSHRFDLDMTPAMCSAATTVEVDAALHGELISHSVATSVACR
jgi:fimbrial chaperone protein